MSLQQPTLLQAAQAIVRTDGTMEEPFRYWAQLITQLQPIVDTGSPEGVFEAAQYTLYIDETDPLNPVQYRKMLTDIGGDRTQGWVQV